MEGKLAFFIALVLVGVALAQEKCCYPARFLIREGTQTGLDDKGKDHVVFTDSSVAFDKDKQMLGSLTQVFYGEHVFSFHIIQNFNQSFEYRIDTKEEKCQKLPLKGDYPACVPVSMLSLAGFYNYTTEFDSDKYFEVPSFCPKPFTEEPKMHRLFDPMLMR